MAGVTWTAEEDDHLRQLWNSDLTVEELLPEFPGRTINSIRVHAKRLGLRHTREQFLQVLSKTVSGSKNGMYDRRSPRKGVTLSSELRTKLSVAAREGYAAGRRKGMFGPENPAFGKPSPMRGKHLPESAKRTLAIKATQRWDARSQESKEEHLSRMRTGWSSWSLAKGPTKIELLVQEWLTEFNVQFTTQAVVSFFVVDFLVGSDKIIETHGDYWHGNPVKYAVLDQTQRSNQRRDRAKWTLLSKRGFKLLALWEDDLWNRPEECRDRLQEFLV